MFALKKIAAALLVFAMLFGFAACKNDKTDKAPSVEGATQKTDAMVYEELKAQSGLEENYHYSELKSDDGVVRFIVKMTLPKFTEKTCSEDIASVLNYFYETEFYEKDSHFAKINVDSAKKYMTQHETDTPWSIQTSFEVRYFDGSYICIVMKRSFSYGGNATPVISARCFKLSDGDTCSSNDFYLESVDEATKSIILDTIKERAKTELNPKATLTDEQLAKIDAAFNPHTGYYITRDGITFFFDKSLVDPSQFGNYECFFAWHEVDYIYQIPVAQ